MRYFQIALLSTFLLIASVLQISFTAEAKERDSAKKYYDVYLTDGEICKKCRTEKMDGDHIRLTNAQGAWTILPMKRFIGIDYHPSVRKLLNHSLHNIGPKGPEIVPYAFENMNDYVCRYCQREHI